MRSLSGVSEVVGGKVSGGRIEGVCDRGPKRGNCAVDRLPVHVVAVSGAVSR
jgi:hypothetical protein